MKELWIPRTDDKREIEEWRRLIIAILKEFDKRLIALGG